VEVDDKLGALANLCELIASNAINIKAIATNGSGCVKIVTEDEATTREALKKAKLLFSENDIMGLRLLDRPGELSKIARILANAKVNIHSAYMLGGNGETKDMILKVSNVTDALKALR